MGRALIVFGGFLLLTGGVVLGLYPEQPSKRTPIPPTPTFNFELFPFSDPLNSDYFLIPDPLEQELEDIEDLINAEKEKAEILQEIIEIQKELNKLYELDRLKREGKLWSA